MAVYGKVKDDDILVLPLDVLNFDTHSSATQKVLKYFGKVSRSYKSLNVFYQYTSQSLPTVIVPAMLHCSVS